MGWTDRTELLLGIEAVEKLRQSHVLIAGLGGVGGMTVEMLVRAGIGEITMVDADVVSVSNRNRQLIALQSNEGQSKALEWEKRLLDINPDLILHVHHEFLRDEAIPELLSKPFDFVVDAIDTLAPKVFLIYHAMNNGHKLVSSLGSGSKLAPEKIEIADISKSHNCKLGFYVRKRLHKLGVHTGFEVVFSPEPSIENSFAPNEDPEILKSTVGTISYMPNAFGAFMASVVVRNLLGVQR
jgi:tRNA A37 threonylcarbamoyladenosine dehydratase